QGLIVILPKRNRTITINTPYAGQYEWWSGMGDDLNNTLTRTIDLTGVGSAALTAKGWYQIEAGYDYLYAEVSTDGGASWTAIPGTVNGTAIGTDGGGKPGLDGFSNGWVDLAYDLSAYAGQSIQFRFRYYTDGGVAYKGFAADEIAIVADGQTVFTDGAESGDNGWTASGFSRFQGSATNAYSNYYIAEYRQYRGFDDTLRTGPYNFPDPTGNWVEHFPYQDGLLISYWDTFYRDNNVGAHPGEGLILPIDAHPQPLLRANGTPWRTRIQVFDATFSLEPTDAITLSSFDAQGNLVPVTYPSQPGVRAFNDLNSYWFASKPDAGVKVPKTGTVIEVINVNTQGSFMEVSVRPAK
ncbi:MAG: immune inhibitor A, partial [Thermomicrobiaceae bacterium]|nr:immune inhibitor A [Thermomicrobiaceae bacterium]